MKKSTIIQLAMCVCVLIGTNAWAGELDTVSIDVPSASYMTSNTDYIYRVSDGEVELLLYKGSGGDVVIPDTIDGFPVVGIDYYFVCRGVGDEDCDFSGAFQARPDLTSVTIPDSVTVIGLEAFEGCTGLTSVTIPDSVTHIENQAFKGCTGLTSLFLSKGVISLEYQAFALCSSLTDIVIDVDNPVYSSHDGVVYNKGRTELILFPGGKSGSFTIPDGVTSIARYGFTACDKVTSVVIPDSVTNIDSFAFYGCKSLTSVTIGNGVPGIGSLVFAHCDALASVTIPDSVTSIGQEAFYGCSSLTSVAIPGSVTYIERGAFKGCTGLTTAYFLGNTPTMGTDVFLDTAPDFEICYTTGATGFSTPNWEGYPAAPCACSDDTDCAEGEMCASGRCEIDIDFDGIINAEDNCPEVANPAQENVDVATETGADILGDVCDADTVYGYVDISGAAIENVNVTVYRPNCGGDIELDSDTTDSEGYYSFSNLGVGYRTIVPELESYTFVPETDYPKMPQAEIQSFDFTATVIPAP